MCDMCPGAENIGTGNDLLCGACVELRRLQVIEDAEYNLQDVDAAYVLAPLRACAGKAGAAVLQVGKERLAQRLLCEFRNRDDAAFVPETHSPVVVEVDREGLGLTGRSHLDPVLLLVKGDGDSFPFTLGAAFAFGSRFVDCHPDSVIRNAAEFNGLLIERPVVLECCFDRTRNVLPEGGS